MNWILFSPLLFGQEPDKTEEPVAEIIVEASKDYEVFIAPVSIILMFLMFLFQYHTIWYLTMLVCTLDLPRYLMVLSMNP